MENLNYLARHRHSFSVLPSFDLNGESRLISGISASLVAESRLQKLRNSGRYDRKIQLLMSDMDPLTSPTPSSRSNAIIPPILSPTSFTPSRTRSATECEVLEEEITLAKRQSRSTVCSESEMMKLLADEAPTDDWMCKSLTFGDLSQDDDHLSF